MSEMFSVDLAVFTYYRNNIIRQLICLLFVFNGTSF